MGTDLLGSPCITTGLNHKWFSKSLMAVQLPSATTQLAAKLRFVDYGSILELNSSVNRSVEYQG